MVVGEWLPVHGGLPRFNRDLASALAGHGHHVTSIAAKPEPADYKDARARGVHLVSVGEDLRVGRSQVPGGVDVVVGHARAAFAPAVAQARRDFPGAALAVVVHTVPGELAPFREGKDLVTARQEAQVRTDQIVGMCQGAQVVYGVGPHLAGYWQERLGRPVHEVVPGLDTTGRPVAGPPDGERRVLLLGRMEDRQIKGVDIAAAAFAHLPEQVRDNTQFVVMGTPKGTEAQLAQTLHQEYGVPRDQIQVEPYSSNPQKVVDQLEQASVLVMPSRAEGYGLVAHEAVSLGVPALVSDRSGFGQLLARQGAGQGLVVPVSGDLGRDRDRWAEALAGALEDPAGHFDQARAARGRLATWPQVAHDWTGSLHQARSGRPAASTPGPGHPTDLGPAPAPGAAPAQPLPPVPQHLGGLPVRTGHSGPGQPPPSADLPVGMQHLADRSAARTGHSRPGQPPPSADLPVGMQHLGGPEAQERGRAAFQPDTPGPAPPVGPTPPARPPGAKKDPGVGR